MPRFFLTAMADQKAVGTTMFIFWEISFCFFFSLNFLFVSFDFYRVLEFKTNEEAEKAIKELTDSSLKGRKIFVREVKRLTFTSLH